jgi:curved DNA-binding protein CbpA
MSQDTKAVRDEIRAMHARLQTISYYELFEVPADLDNTAIKDQVQRQFRQLAKKWHIDRYSGQDLGDERSTLQEIFATINTAQATLTDPNKRAAYDLERSGSNTDITSIINAETAFRKGQSMLSTGANKGAHEQFRLASQANQDDKEYRAHFLYTSYLELNKDANGHVTNRGEAQKIYDELNEISQKLVDRDWLLAFLGVVCLGLKRDKEAQSLFYQATSLNSKNLIAQRQMRLLKMRSEQKKGFFGQLMDKLSAKK